MDHLRSSRRELLFTFVGDEDVVDCSNAGINCNCPNSISPQGVGCILELRKNSDIPTLSRFVSSKFDTQMYWNSNL